MTVTQSQQYILVVDDLPDNQFLVKLALEQEGYTVLTLDSGISALEQIEKCPPRLILLDVMMPQMDGLEVTRRIRNNPNLPFIPIILITAYKKNSVVEGLDAGADEFICKPFQLDELQARVRSLLRLKETIDQRETFVSCMTHDLRTPLVASNRMLFLIKKGAFGAVPETIREALDNIVTSNENLLDLLNNILEVYGYEIGKKFLNFKSFNFGELVEEVTRELSSLATNKKLDLRWQKETDVNQIVGDRLELRRVVMNLISNAIKFTEQGEVNIRLKSVMEAENQMVLLEVEDTGIGISQENRHKIFDRFTQGHHKLSGQGLGLYLCNKIVQSHHGRIEVDSERGKGSLFRIFLPVNMETKKMTV